MAIVSKRYVDALYNSTNNVAERGQIHNELKKFTELYNSNLELKNILNDPRVVEKIKFDIVNEILKGDTEYFINFIKLLIKEKRINLLNEMLFEYEKKDRTLKKELLIKIIVTDEIGDNQVEKIIQKFKEMYKVNTVKYSIEIDKNLLGGIKVIVGDTVYDASIKRQLDNIF